MLRVSLQHAFPANTLSMAFEAPTPGVTALFGPSGAGKSSLMLAIAGLLRADRLCVELDDEALHAIPPEQRGIGYVFQDGRLFPHMNVRANLGYGLRRAAPGPFGLDEVVALLGLGGLLARRPGTLSGGERQRVAVGRALLRQPRLLLMDEPLAALDQQRRDEILPYLARLGAQGVPIVYASHSMDEVRHLADTLVLIEGGRVRAAGPLEEVASRIDLPLAAREDAGGMLRGRVASHDARRRLTSVACGADLVWVPPLDLPEGAPVRLLVPAREVIIALDAPLGGISVNNVLPAVVTGVGEPTGGHAALVSLKLAGGQLVARVTWDAAHRLRLRPGLAVLALVKSMSVEWHAEHRGETR